MGGRVDDRYDLRFGNICSLYYRDILGMKSVPKQIDLLDGFFPGLAVWEMNPDGILVLRDDHAISDSCAYMESLLPEQIEPIICDHLTDERDIECFIVHTACKPRVNICPEFPEFISCKHSHSPFAVFLSDAQIHRAAEALKSNSPVSHRTRAFSKAPFVPCVQRPLQLQAPQGAVLSLL